MFKITGLDALQRQLSEAQEAMARVDGELGTLTFNPHEPESIEHAIQDAERLIDERLGAYASNSIVGPLITQMKAHFREAVLEKAAAARLEQDSSDDEQS